MAPAAPLNTACHPLPRHGGSLMGRQRRALHLGPAAAGLRHRGRWLVWAAAGLDNIGSGGKDYVFNSKVRVEKSASPPPGLPRNMQGDPECPNCKGTGEKKCGQCNGTGVNQEELFGGKFKKGDICWLCAGRAVSMCGSCIDITDAF